MKKRWVAVVFLLALMICGMANAYAGIQANEIIDTAQVVLSASTKKAAFTMRTKVACNVLSVTSYSLYKSNGSVVTSGSITSTSSGMRYSKSVDFSGYITSGNSYYVTAVFNADGETKNASSATVSY